MAKCLTEWLSDWNLQQPVAQVAIRHLTLDSRQVNAGDCFIAMQGTAANGEAYIEQAVGQGAVAVVVDAESSITADDISVALIKIADLAGQLPKLAQAFYSQPKQARIIGVTGTNGKTTIATGLCQALNLLGHTAWLSGTLGSGALDNLQASANTTPDIISNWRLLAEASKAGAEYLVMEVSSHGIAQNRVASLPIEVAVFSNLSHEHLDYHQTIEEYGACKRRLFLMDSVKHVVLNSLDDFGRQLAFDQEISASKWLLAAADGSGSQTCRLLNIELDSQGMTIECTFSGQSLTIQSKLLGSFNAENLLQIALTLWSLGFELTDIVKAASSILPVTGRMHGLQLPNKPLVIVDYAHTPDALKNALTAARAHSKNQLWCVFGCGGDRDTSKRPLMGQIAAELADQVVITSDNPRSEQPAAIISQIMAGIDSPEKVNSIEDRKQAIDYVIAQADIRDVVLIAGKGHEDYQEVNGIKQAFSDIETARSCLEARP